MLSQKSVAYRFVASTMAAVMGSPPVFGVGQAVYQSPRMTVDHPTPNAEMVAEPPDFVESLPVLLAERSVVVATRGLLRPHPP